jgi:hypothetical protein
MIHAIAYYGQVSMFLSNGQMHRKNRGLILAEKPLLNLTLPKKCVVHRKVHLCDNKGFRG